VQLMVSGRSILGSPGGLTVKESEGVSKGVREHEGGNGGDAIVYYDTIL
jgi:hypothetical protein